MKIKIPTLGPILGDYNENSFKIWIRVDNTEENKIHYAIVQVLQDNTIVSQHIQKINQKKSAYQFGTVVVNCDKPQENLDYSYRAGYIKFQDDIEELSNVSLNWNEIQNFSLPKNLDNANSIKFLLGSCRHCGAGYRYPNEGDIVFKSIVNKHLHQYDFNLFIGDQVYADFYDGDVWLPNKGAKNKKQYFKKYYQAYNQDNFKIVTANKPTYMILDDHELWNNFNAQTDKKKPRYKAALESYIAHQASFSPNSYANNILDQNNSPKLNYEFNQGDFKFFVLDIRTQRDKSKNRMFSKDQEKKLFKWIEDHKKHPYPKFIVSGVPLFPDVKGPMAEAGDKWTGFPEHRIKIFEKLKKNYKFIFLSGDVHVSYVSSLSKKNKNKPFTYNIVSSALNWPQIGMQWWHFRWNKRLIEFKNDQTKKKESGYISKFLGPKRKYINESFKTVPKNNYAIVTATKNSVSISYYKSSNGKKIGNSINIDLS